MLLSEVAEREDVKISEKLVSSVEELFVVVSAEVVSVPYAEEMPAVADVFVFSAIVVNACAPS